MSFETRPFCAKKCTRVMRVGAENPQLTTSCPAYVGPRMERLIEDHIEYEDGVPVDFTLSTESAMLASQLLNDAREEVANCIKQVQSGQPPIDVYEL